MLQPLPSRGRSQRSQTSRNDFTPLWTALARGFTDATDTRV